MTGERTSGERHGAHSEPRCSFTAVVLAGGQSRRMRRDKARLGLGGVSLIERQLRVLQALAPTELFIAARTSGDYSDLGCPVLADAFPGQGPVAGIERALARASSGRVLVLAVDLPFMTSTTLEQLLLACNPSVGAVPRIHGELEPLAACYPKAAHALAVERLDAGQNSARGFALACLERGLARALELPTAAADQFANWNSPEDVVAGPGQPACEPLSRT